MVPTFNETTTSNYTIARQMAALGLPVFPCRERTLHTVDGRELKAKAPYTRHGFKDATTEPEQIRAWWDMWPEALPGVANGKASGLAVVDGDVDKQTGEPTGARQMAALGLSHPRAVGVRTPSGGLHLLYRHVPGAKTTSKQVADHVDTRADGGYIIAPGAIMRDGTAYTYIGRSVAEALEASDLPDYPLDTIEKAIQSSKDRRQKGQHCSEDARADRPNAGQAEATEAETLTALRRLLSKAPNTLARQDWVKLAFSLRDAFGETLRDDFVTYSLRYGGGTACTTKAAEHVWESAQDPDDIKGPGSALYLLKHEIGVTEYKAIWRAVFAERDAATAEDSNQGDIALPLRGFKLTPTGIYFETTTKDGETKWRFLCSPVRVLALPRGADGKGWGRLLEIEDPDGKKWRWAAPAELFAGDGVELRRECMRLGLRLSTARGARAAFGDLLQQWTPDARATTTERLGWADETCTAFVVGSGRVIGDEGVVYQTEHAPGAAAEMRPAGTLDEWRETVGTACTGNSMMVLAVSLAFAGALLEPMQTEGGGIHLRGQSSRGKSTVMRAAVSVWGSPKFLQSWRATSNGLEGVASACNASLIALDEMGEIAAREAGATAYMLANGQGKARAARSGAARTAARWKVAILSSGEISLADKMAEAGQRARAGQEVRLLDIQADGQTFGAFDDLHGQTDAADFADQVARMAATSYGTAGPAFVERIVADLDGTLGKLRVMLQAFTAQAAGDLDLPSEGQTRRALHRFALIAVAGEMATAWGLTGWPEGEASRAAVVGLRLWLDGRGGAGSSEDRAAIDRTRAFIVAHGDARFERLDEISSTEGPRVHKRAGWREGLHYYIASDVWASEVHAGADPTQAARAVQAAGFLVTDNDGHRLKRRAPRNVPGRPRCYCVLAEIMGGDDD